MIIFVVRLIAHLSSEKGVVGLFHGCQIQGIHYSVRPQLEYACSLWNPYTKRNIHQIELVQHRAARFVF